jgi:RimJ/RimL family protein N-acetyltransferase
MGKLVKRKRWLQPVALAHTHVRLIPLSKDHLQGLCLVGLDERLWRHTTNRIETVEAMADYIDEAITLQKRGLALPFTILFGNEERIIGSTRFGNIDERNKRVEIGWTWIGVPWQRTAVNTEMKYLMLRHAFETAGCVRVEFKTDKENMRSRSALERIGAREEGILRRHMMTHTGRFRDTVYYSILDSEWEKVRAVLEMKMSYDVEDRRDPPGNPWTK